MQCYDCNIHTLAVTFNNVLFVHDLDPTPFVSELEASPTVAPEGLLLLLHTAPILWPWPFIIWPLCSWPWPYPCSSWVWSTACSSPLKACCFCSIFFLLGGSGRLLTPLTFAWHHLSPLAAFTSSAYFLHNGRWWQWICKFYTANFKGIFGGP